MARYSGVMDKTKTPKKAYGHRNKGFAITAKDKRYQEALARQRVRIEQGAYLKKGELVKPAPIEKFQRKVDRKTVKAQEKGKANGKTAK